MATDRKKRKIRLFKFKKDKKKPETVKENQPKNSNKHSKRNSDTSEQNSKLKLINGKRKKNLVKRIVVYSLIVAVVIAIFVINLLTPTGIIEALQNKYNAMGEGIFPINVYSTNAKAFSSFNNMYGVLNDSFFELYNPEGKLIQAVSHGMSNAQLEVSEARYLIYDRDRYTLSVYNYGDKLFGAKYDDAISSADIGRDGTFAVVTDSKSFQNTVYVYNKNNESVFTWNSANYYVTDVAVADDGESIAVCLLNSVGGAFESFVYILEFDSAEPVFRFKFNDIVSSLTSCGENYILANGFDRAYTIPWNSGAEYDLKVTGIVRCYDFNVNSASCVVSGREDNGHVNTVTVINEFGTINCSFEFNTTVNDVCLNETEIAILTDNEVYVYDHFGALKKTMKSTVKGSFVGIIDTGEVAVLDSSKMIKLEQ